MGKGLSVCTCFLLVTVYLMGFFHVPDPELLFVLPLAVCLAVCLWRCPIRLTFIDTTLLLLWVYGLLSPSVNRTGSLTSATDMAGSLLAYFLMRSLFVGNRQGRERLYRMLTACIGVLALLALYQFMVFDNRIHDAGFDSLYDFRFLYSPLGVPSNEWNALQWLWGGMVAIACLHAANSRFKVFALLTGLMVWATILLSFSRGGYIAILVCGGLFLFSLFINHQLSTSKRSLLVSGSCFVLLTLSICWQYRAEVVQTFRMNETLSQQRSTARRMEALDFAKEVADNHPWGVGKGNYTLAGDYYRRGETRSDSFTSYAGNIAAKALVEGGYAGLAIYCLVMLSVFVRIVRAKRWDYGVVFLFLLGFLIKELTFPTFYDSGIIQLSVFMLLAYIQQDCGRVKAARQWRFAAIIPLFVWVGMFVGRQMHDRAGSTPALIREYVYGHSVEALEKAIEKSPMDVQLHYYIAVENEDTARLAALSADYPDRLLFRRTLCDWYRQNGACDKAADELAHCILRHPRLLERRYWKALLQEDERIADTVLNHLQIVIRTEPEDVMQLAKYGSIALQLGDTLMAEDYLVQANRMLPNLSRVWGNLATVEESKGNTETAQLYRQRMDLIERGIFAIGTDTPQERVNDESPEEREYEFLFMIWYKTNLKQR